MGQVKSNRNSESAYQNVSIMSREAVDRVPTTGNAGSGLLSGIRMQEDGPTFLNKIGDIFKGIGVGLLTGNNTDAPPNNTNTNTDTDPPKKGMGTGLIVALALGGAALIGIVIYLVTKKKKTK